MKSTGMKRLKNLIVAMLTVALALPLALTGFGGAAGQTEAQAAVKKYFYDQLSEKERPFYNAMEAMYDSGLFQTGTENLDLTQNGYLSQADLQKYADGFPDLLTQMGAARDAFYFDHPDIFYVDFSALTLRVTMDSTGTYHAYLGTGRRADYYTQGFTNKAEVENAVAAYEKAVNDIVKGAQELVKNLDPDMDPVREQITYVHNAIAEKTGYKLENSCKPENIGFIRTAYGALVKGEGACEAYARAMKAVLDRLGIPCVLVQGLYRYTEERMELHMWNSVQLNGKWYGVDVTMDDSMGNSELLLAGDDIMGIHHFPSSVVSPVGREFSYPSLSQDTKTFQDVENANGLKVELLSDVKGDETTSTFRVSYNGMGYQEAAAKGKYILVRFYQYLPRTGQYIYNEWAYADPTLYDVPKEDHALIFPASHIMYAEFAVTTTPPQGVFFENGVLDQDYWYFKGDPLLFEAQTKLIYNPYGTYVKPPYPKAYSPSTQGRVYMGQTYDVCIEYDEKLVLSGTGEAGYTLSCSGPTGVTHSEVKNFKWDGDRTITFQFTPSSMFADESVVYTFQFTGLVGEGSGREPIPMKYISSSPCAVRTCWRTGYDWNVFGQPSLLENGDLSTAGWKTSDGSAVSDLLKDRLALVVTRPSQSQSDAMEDMVKSVNPGAEVLASETYNITLTLCQAQVISTGQGVRVSVGFPAGYGPDDEGVTFKAYHFMRNKAGEVTGVEELDCVVTKFGLVITCKSFSPFAIVVTDEEDTSRSTERAVILSGSYGGKISSGRGDVFTLKPNESASVTVSADKGYVIEQIGIGSVARKIADNGTMTFDLSYSDLHAGSNIIDVQFVAESVLEKEKENGETALIVSPEDVVVPVIERPRTSSSTSSGTGSQSGSAPAPAAPSTGTPAGQAPADAVPTTGTPSGSAPAAAPSQPSAPSYASGNSGKTDASPLPEDSDTSAGSVASADINLANTGAETGLVILPLAEEEIPEGAGQYWFLLPLLLLAAAAVGAIAYYMSNRKGSDDDWV